MNKNIKSFVALILVMLMLPIYSISFATEEASEVIYYSTDFESSSHIAFGLVGGLINTTENHYDNVLSITPNMEVSGNKFSEYAMNLNSSKKNYVIGFDFKALQTGHEYTILLRDFSGAKYVDFVKLILDNEGNIKINEKSAGTYTAGQWYSVDIDISDDKTIKYYIDGELKLTEDDVNTFFPTNLYFGTSSEGADGSERLYIDNISVADSGVFAAAANNVYGGDRYVKVELSHSTKSVLSNDQFSIISADNHSLAVLGHFIKGHNLYLYVNEDIKPYTEYILTMPNDVKSVSDKGLVSSVVYFESTQKKPVVGEIIARNDFESGSTDSENIVFTKNAGVNAEIIEVGDIVKTKALKLTVANSNPDGNAKYVISGDSLNDKDAIVQYDVLLSQSDAFSFMNKLNTTGDGTIFAYNAAGQIQFLKKNTWPDRATCMDRGENGTHRYVADYGANRWYRVTLCVNREAGSEYGVTDIYLDNTYIGSTDAKAGLTQEDMLISSLDFMTYGNITFNNTNKDGNGYQSGIGTVMYIDNLKIGYSTDNAYNVIKSRVTDVNGRVYRPTEVMTNTPEEIAIYFSGAVDTSSINKYSVRLAEKNSGKKMNIAYSKFYANNNCLVMTVEEEPPAGYSYDLVVDGVTNLLGEPYPKYVAEYKISGTEGKPLLNNDIIDALYISHNTIKVSGRVVSGMEGIPVTAVVLKGDKTLSELDAANAETYFGVAANQNQTTTEAGGYFDFTFDVPAESDDVYNVNIYTSDNDKLTSGIVKANQATGEMLACDVVSAAFGNSFYDPSKVEFNVSVVGDAESYNLKAVVRSRTDNSVVGEVSDIIQATEGSVDNYALNIDMSNMAQQYGSFSVDIEIMDAVSKHAYKCDTRYTVSNSMAYGLKKADTGFANHFQAGQAIGRINENINLELNAGAGLVREEIHWDKFEAEKGVYKLTERQQEWLNGARAKEIKPLVILAFDNPLYEGTNPPTTDDALKAYGDYVYNVVLQTKDYTDSYEVWNEYNLGSGEEWTAENYAKLLQVAYNRAKDANPNCKIYGFAAGRKCDDYDTTKWIGEVLIECNKLENGKKFMDGFSYHPYDLEGGTPEGINIKNEVSAIRAKFTEFGYNDIKVIASEMGYTSDESRESQYKQAKYSVRFAALAEDKLDALIWYVSGEKEVPRADFEQYGFFKNVGAEIPCETKPVYAAVTNYNNLTADMHYADDSLSDGVYTYKFENDFGGQLWMLWSETNSDKKHKIDFMGHDFVRVYDIYGNCKVYESSNGLAELNITDAPVYIEYPKSFSMYVKNSDGMAITKREGIGESSFTVVAKADKTLTEFEDAVLIIGCYENGALKKAVTDRLEYTNSPFTSEDVEIEITNEGYDEVKLFVWNGESRAIPLVESIEIN